MDKPLLELLGWALGALCRECGCGKKLCEHRGTCPSGQLRRLTTTPVNAGNQGEPEEVHGDG